MDFLKNISGNVEEFLRPHRNKLPMLARILVVATFVEDGIRLLFQWDLQTRYLNGLGYYAWFSMLFLFSSCLVQTVGSMLIVFGKYLKPALVALGTFIVVQMIIYRSVMDWTFFVRNTSLIGGLLMLAVAHAEGAGNKKTAFPGLPSLHTKGYSTQMQLIGRILLVLLFISIIWGPITFWRIVVGIIGSILCTMIVVGLKARQSAFLLLVILSISNLIVHNFWTLDSKNPERDFQKYYFFQTTSVLGGLVLLVFLGPGAHSIDEKNKET